MWESAYLPIDPADVGRRYEEVVRINSQSGKGGVVHVLERDYGITLPRWLQVEFAKVVQKDAEDSGGEINAARIHQLFNQRYLATEQSWQMHSYDLHRTAEGVQTTISIGDQGGIQTVLKGEGSGAVSALADALSRRYGESISVESFDEFSLGDNTDASAMACVRVKVGERLHSAAALAQDTTSAALQAVLNVAGQLLVDAGVDVSDRAVIV